jgi:hypothetical protein
MPVLTPVTPTPSPTALNAVKHGILSSQLLLPSESATDYATLLSDLLSEYEPKTITEETLVQDIANTIWRKRRLLSAERASISTGLNDSISIPLTLINDSSPIHLNVENTASIRHLLAFDTPTLSQYKKSLAEAFRGLSGDFSESDISSLFEFLENNLPYPIHKRLEELAELEELTKDNLISTVSNLLHTELQSIEYIETIRQQAYGAACCHINFDVVARYDSALDRKLLRLLDALMTVQTKRKAKEKASASITV